MKQKAAWALNEKYTRCPGGINNNIPIEVEDTII